MAKVSLRAYNREIETMIDRGQLDEAIAHCHHIFKTFPKHLETYRLLGKAYLEYKRYGDAVDIFTRVLVSVPNDFVANVGMSIIRDEENKLDDAIWHMERAFEIQPSNPAIQGELQRLYGRRDGVAPPRIRMTRGALAHMYVQGELYPQAISEIKSVLKEDGGRSDMQALLARAHYRSGQKNEAAEVASSLLRRYPFCQDANRVLAEILGTDKPENAKLYRDRVVELDPYAAHVNGTLFQSSEASDQAVTIEHLDWNGQPTGTGAQADWRESRAITTGSIGRGREEQPDWLRNPATENVPTVPPTPKHGSDFQPSASSALQPAQPTPSDEIPEFLRSAGWGQSTGAFDESKSAFADVEPVSGTEPLAQGDLPDWVKAMAPKPEEAQPTAEEEMPDWINKIGPASTAAAAATSAPADDDWMSQLAQPSQPAGDQPDWLQGLGTESQTPAQTSSDQPDWLSGLGEDTPATQPSGEPDWMKGLGEETPSEQPSSELDWMKGLGEETPSEQPASETNWMKGLGEETPSEQPSSELDWVKGLGEETPSEKLSSETDWMKGLGEETPSEKPSSELDWMKDLTQETSSTGSSPRSQEPDWLQGLGEETAPAAPQAEESDWLKQFDVQPQQPGSASEITDFSFLDELKAEPVQPSAPVTPPAPTAETSNLGTSQQEIDDSLAWLENLAAKQGATEGLLTKPEERLEEEPDWIKQAKGISTQPPVQQPTAAPPSVPQSTPEKIDDLGKSQQEIDDSLAWLEGLAAKQGATEGLLTKPEERLEQEPEWVKKVKSTTGPLSEQKAPEPPVQPVQEAAPEPMPVAVEQPPVVNVEDLGKSQSEIDDSLAWLEGLAAKQGATEGLLTKPEERLEQEPEWVRKVKSTTGKLHEQKASEAEPVVPQMEAATPEPLPVEPPVANVEDLGKSQREIDDSLAWLEGLAAKQGATEGLLTKPEERLEDEPEWVKQAKSAPPTPAEPVSFNDTAAWLKTLDDEESKPESVPTPGADETAMWLKGLDEEKLAAKVEPASTADETAMWLKSLDEEKPSEKTEPTSSADETAMWLKSLDEEESKPEPAQPAQDDLPAWMQAIEEEKPSAAEPAIPAVERDDSAWMEPVEEPVAEQESLKLDEDGLPTWLSDLEKEEQEAEIVLPASQDDLPSWLRDETGEVVAEPTRIEPTRPTDWKPAEETREETPAPPPPDVEVRSEPTPEPKPVSKPAKKAPAKTEVKPATPPEPYKEPVTRSRGTGMLSMPIDPILHTARTELSRSNVPSALETYGKLIKKGRFLDEVIFDLREALYRYPVEVSLWQSLGDAYMRANRLQDALDAYTKAEELLR